MLSRQAVVNTGKNKVLKINTIEMYSYRSNLIFCEVHNTVVQIFFSRNGWSFAPAGAEVTWRVVTRHQKSRDVTRYHKK